MDAKIEIKSLNLWYHQFHALMDVSFSIRPMAITAIISPSSCGKSTLLRVINRMNEIIPHVKISGDVLLDGNSIYDGHIDLHVMSLRRKLGEGGKWIETIRGFGYKFRESLP
jgi:phosphate transport system ATP-binding protein